MIHYQTNQGNMYSNTYRYWAQDIAELAYPDRVSNPLYNDHREFHRWLHNQYGVKVRFRNLNYWLEFPDSRTETFFMLRWP